MHKNILKINGKPSKPHPPEFLYSYTPDYAHMFCGFCDRCFSAMPVVVSLAPSVVAPQRKSGVVDALRKTLRTGSPLSQRTVGYSTRAGRGVGMLLHPLAAAAAADAWSDARLDWLYV